MNRFIINPTKRVGNYFFTKAKDLKTDYVRTAKDTFIFAKNQPLKATKNTIISSYLIYCFYNCSNYQNYSNELQNKRNDMVDYGVNRNKLANDYIQKMSSLDKKDLLTVDSYGCFSVIRERKYSKYNCSPEAVFDRQKGRWYNPFHWYYSAPKYWGSVRDVSLGGKFLALEWALGGYPDVDVSGILGEKSEKSQKSNLQHQLEISLQNSKKMKEIFERNLGFLGGVKK